MTPDLKSGQESTWNISTDNWKLELHLGACWALAFPSDRLGLEAVTAVCGRRGNLAKPSAAHLLPLGPTQVEKWPGPFSAPTLLLEHSPRPSNGLLSSLHGHQVTTLGKVARLSSA